MNKKRIRSKLLLLLLSLLFSLIVTETTLRVLGYSPYLINTDLFVPTENELMPYKMRAGYRARYLVFQNELVEIDEDGYRVVKPDIESASGAAAVSESETIVILGDSVVFGHGLRDNETVASQLQSAVNQEEMNIRVRNIAVTGYTSWNEYEALKDYFAGNKADLVLLFYVVNDITHDNNNLNMLEYESEGRFTPVTRFLYRNLYTFSLLTEYRALLYPVYTEVTRMLNQDEISNAERYRSQVNKDALEYSIEAVVKIHELCERNGSDFYVVLPRTHTGNISVPTYYSVAEGMISDELKKKGIKVVELDDHLNELSQAESRIAFNDQHPSRLAVSSFVGELIEKLGLAKP